MDPLTVERLPSNLLELQEEREDAIDPFGPISSMNCRVCERCRAKEGALLASGSDATAPRPWLTNPALFIKLVL